MATSQSTNTLTKEAAAALTSKQFYIMKIDTSGKIAIAAAATDPLVGILQDSSDVAAGQVCTVRSGGGSKVIYGGTVDEGDLLTSDSSGRAVATTTDKQVIIGRAMVAGVVNDIGECKINIFTLSAT